jgi:sulfur carrier protein
MQIRVNGEIRDFPEAGKINHLLQTLGLTLEGIVVTLNQTILKKTEWDQIIIKENDVIELISFVGGG